MFSILAGIVALSLLIIIHEFGHFVAAKLAGMHVDRFSVFGIGAPICRLATYRDTEYVISAVPFGAYVHIVGMEVQEDDTAIARSIPTGKKDYRDAGIVRRMAAIVGGPFANYVAAMAIMVVVFAGVGTQHITGMAVAGFDEGSPARAAGLREGDRFLAIRGQALSGPNSGQVLNETTSTHLGQTVDVLVERNGEQLTFPVTLNAHAPALQTRLKPVAEWQKLPLPEALSAGIRWPINTTVENLRQIGQMISGEQEGSLAGPVGIVDQLRQSARRGLLDFVVFVALISTVVGMTNLLPLPALDGGRLMFLMYEAVARRPFNRLIEERIHAVGMLCLLGLIFVVTAGEVYDRVSRLFG